MPSARTTVVVRGRPNPLQAAGRDAGLKLMEIKRLRAKGIASRCSTKPVLAVDREDEVRLKPDPRTVLSRTGAIRL
jgi:hypothetical protein